MAFTLENGISQSGQALPMGGMDLPIPLSLALARETTLRRDLFDRTTVSERAMSLF